MKKFALKSLSILLATVFLVAVLPLAALAEDINLYAVRPCEHDYEVRNESTCAYVSDRLHLKTDYTITTCLLCGDATVDEGAPYFEYHDVEELNLITYLYVSNEYHRTQESVVKIGVSCDCHEIVDVRSYDDWHEFDASVDPEVDMSGVCIRCHVQVYW